jgi:exopolysaccharide biosynthesis polyprenyl glycosylphosphotransferase
MNKTKNKIFWISLLIGDFLLFYLSLYLAIFLRKFGLPNMEIFNELQLPFLYLFFIWSSIFFIFDFYEVSFFRKKIFFVKTILIFIFLATSIGTVYFYFQPQLGLTPRAILFLAVLNFAIFSSLWRMLFLKIIGLKNFKKNVFFLGYCDEIEEILEGKIFDYNIVGIYTKESIPNKIKEKTDVFDTLAKIKDFSENIDVLVFSPELKENKKIIKIIFSSFPLNMNYVDFFNFYEEVMRKVPLRSLDEWWFLENISKKKNRMDKLAKRIFEVAGSFLGIIILIVFFPIIAFLIKIDSSGTVLYRQKRRGENGKDFTLYKFRTMHESYKDDVVPWREEDKKEITRVGNFLRNTHLDELPQFYNIIKGDISFVGPRPESVLLVENFEKNIPFYKLRYLVKPGLTGWAQINYPPSMNAKEAEEKFKYDLYYIKNCSLFFDITIILKTLRTIF